MPTLAGNGQMVDGDALTVGTAILAALRHWTIASWMRTLLSSIFGHELPPLVHHALLQPRWPECLLKAKNPLDLGPAGPLAAVASPWSVPSPAAQDKGSHHSNRALNHPESG